MNKNKFIYILIMVIALFGFKSNVYAAQELTCKYKTPWYDVTTMHMILIQTAEGKIEIWKNYGRGYDSFDSPGWEKKTKAIVDLTDSSLQKDKDGYLKQCPASETRNNGNPTFYGDESGKRSLDKENSYTEVKRPGVLPQDNDYPTTNNGEPAQELTCKYEVPLLDEAMILIQTAEGKIEIWYNDTYKDYNDPGWYKTSLKADLTDSNLQKDNNGYLKQCPTSETRNNGNPTFYGDESGKRNLDTKNSYTEVKRPQILTEDNDYDTTVGKSCASITGSKWISKTDNTKAYCLYERDLSDGCHIIQLDITAEGDVTAHQQYPNATGKTVNPNNSWIRGFGNEVIDMDTIKKAYSGYCPTKLYGTVYAPIDTDYITIQTTYSFSGNNGSEYQSIGAEGVNLNDPNKKQDINISDFIAFDKINIDTCEKLLGTDNKLKDMLKTAISIVKIAIPIILIVMGSLDFAIAVFSSNEDGMKKAQSKFIKRVIIAVAIFLIPSVLKIILGIASAIWPVIDADLCGLL